MRGKDLILGVLLASSMCLPAGAKWLDGVDRLWGNGASTLFGCTMYSSDLGFQYTMFLGYAGRFPLGRALSLTDSSLRDGTLRYTYGTPADRRRILALFEAERSRGTRPEELEIEAHMECMDAF